MHKLLYRFCAAAQTIKDLQLQRDENRKKAEQSVSY